METNTKVQALKRCRCRQCKASRGNAVPKRERVLANRRLRRAFRGLLSKEDASLAMVQSLGRM